MSKKTKISISLIGLFIISVLLLYLDLCSGFDFYIYNLLTIIISPTLTVIMKSITVLGNTTTIVALCVVLLLFKTTRIPYGYPITITVSLSSLINNIIKLIVARQRPSIWQMVVETSYSFPSGHAMVSASLYTFLILIILKQKKSIKRTILISLLVLLTGLIGISRVYLGVHYISDVLAGFILGIAVSLLVYEYIISKTGFYNDY